MALLFFASLPTLRSFSFSLFSNNPPAPKNPIASELCLTSPQEARWRDYVLIFSDGTKAFVAAERWRGRPLFTSAEPSLPYAQYMSCLKDAIGRYERDLASLFRSSRSGVTAPA
jgi:hypothetical protein